MTPYTLRIANEQDAPAITDFVNTHWDFRHPLVNLPDFFNYYYNAHNGKLNFVLAEQEGQIVGLSGFVPASQDPSPDVWTSIWVADKTAKGSGMDVMEALPKLTGCRSFSSNNIRPQVRPLYEFLGNVTDRMGHFYRLADKKEYSIALIENKTILPVSGTAQLTRFENEQQLWASGFTPPKSSIPYKDEWYISRRYFHYPHQTYDVYGAYAPEEKVPFGILAARVIEAEGSAVLRIADYIGPAHRLPELGNAIDRLLAQYAEYADLYCVGISPELLEKAGFTERLEDDHNIIPNYLTPLLQKNIDYYYCTSHPEGFTMFKADGDQDRPNIT